MKNSFCIRLVFVALLLLVTPIYAAAPWIIRISGDPLAKPIFMTDWHENQKLLVAVKQAADVSEESLAKRPHLKLALFWGPDWINYTKSGKTLEQLRHEDGNQFGRFFPAYRGAEAVFTLDSPAPNHAPQRRRIDEDGLKLLKKYGLPLSLE
ncbi:MAG: hypothetical protein HOP19_03925 [Acidobacteria bacterium]|nr:hypothetical protein [Acidobacteriota bacterium]